ncbi:hypothetical protein H8K33_12075 [Undibacterium amnicola]|uniref:Uncharacterized protein n=1 Tax=Undibacterium amnicola TaxID=1834038 RepID=A0ABR6XSA5_9BURK|nr:hypothetical protein [Undibacterium amnicola]MBC3832253.1 hypothetical protein [Undibacterium amnicola]
MAARNWTDEQKAIQAAKIRTWKPWRLSTGAKTLEGKAIVSKNRAIGTAKRQIEIEQAKKDFFYALDRLAKLTGK